MKKQRGVTFKEAFCSLEKKQLHFLSKQTKYRNPLCFHDWINKLILKDNSYCFTLLICGGPCHLSSLKHFHLIHRMHESQITSTTITRHYSFIQPAYSLWAWAQKEMSLSESIWRTVPLVTIVRKWLMTLWNGPEWVGDRKGKWLVKSFLCGSMKSHYFPSER